jgi:hypothetical protein
VTAPERFEVATLFIATWLAISLALITSLTQDSCP